MGRFMVAACLVLSLSCTHGVSVFFPVCEEKALQSREPRPVLRCEMADYPEERRIELLLTNPLKDGICLDEAFWPNEGGVMGFSEWAPVLVVAGSRFHLLPDDPGYPPGCNKYIAPGETARASLRYAQFGLPEALVDVEKRLEFAPIAYLCKKVPP